MRENTSTNGYIDLSTSGLAGASSNSIYNLYTDTIVSTVTTTNLYTSYLYINSVLINSNALASSILGAIAVLIELFNIDPRRFDFDCD